MIQSIPQQSTPDYISMARIKVRPQIRTRNGFDETSLKGLASTIKTEGIIEPLIVTPAEDGDFWLVAGERRLLAASMAGLVDVPVNIRTADTHSLATVQAIENLQREDLHPADIADGLVQLKTLPQNRNWGDVARSIGKSASWVSKHLALTKLKPVVHYAMVEGKTKDVELLTALDKLARINTPEGHKALTAQLAGLDAGTTTRESVRQALARLAKPVQSTDDTGDGPSDADSDGDDDAESDGGARADGSPSGRKTIQVTEAQADLIKRALDYCREPHRPFTKEQKAQLTTIMELIG